jgi:hypothetical protein
MKRKDWRGWGAGELYGVRNFLLKILADFYLYKFP